MSKGRRREIEKALKKTVNFMKHNIKKGGLDERDLLFVCSELLKSEFSKELVEMFIYTQLYAETRGIIECDDIVFADIDEVEDWIDEVDISDFVDVEFDDIDTIYYIEDDYITTIEDEEYQNIIKSRMQSVLDTIKTNTLERITK